MDNTSEENSEMLQAELFSRGAEGTWEHGGTTGGPTCDDSPLTVDAYFLDEQWCPGLTKTLVAVASAHGCEFPGFALVLDQDWMASHREIAQPVRVGGFVLDPREPDDQGAASMPMPEGDAGGGKQRVIRVPIRRAFGSGSHPTTRLVLGQLQDSDVQGKRVLDVGCGTGILSFAAHLLGTIIVVGYDVDPVAAFLAVENRGLNQVDPSAAHFFAGTAAALGGDEKFDLVMVNVLPTKILGDEAAIGRQVALDGEILLSGLLDVDAEVNADVLTRWEAAGFVEVSRCVEGEWLAVRLSSPRLSSVHDRNQDTI